MDFALSSEQEMLVETARRIGHDYGVDYWRKLDAASQFPHEIWQALCEAGIAGASLPVEHGGSGLGMLETALVVEALTGAGAGMPLAQLFMVNPVFGGRAIQRFGTEAMRREILPGLADGTAMMSFALTEPDAGNNSLRISTTARADGRGWILTGQKTWISGYATSTHLLVVARTSPLDQATGRTHGISMFLIDAKRKGVSAQPIDKVGTRPLPAFTVFFDEVRIEEDELVGTLDGGWPELLELLNGERIVTTAGLIGTGRLAIQLSSNFVRDRRIFGDRAIGSYQGVQFPLAEATASLNASSLINQKAAWLFDRQLPMATEASSAKYLAAEAAFAACDRSMQVMGGMGLANEYHVERLWRDARVFRIAPVPQEMALNYIAMHDLGLPRSY